MAVMREEDEKDAKAIEESKKTAEQKAPEPEAPADASKPKSGFWTWVKDSYSLLRTNSPGSWFAVLLSGLYKRVEGQLKVESGVEMRAGAIEAALVGAKILLGDRPIKVTLNRFVCRRYSACRASQPRAYHSRLCVELGVQCRSGTKCTLLGL